MRFKSEIKWGIILFIVTLLWVIFEKLMGWHGERISQHASYSIIYDFVFLLVYAIAFREEYRKRPGTSLKWSQGFKFGVGITIIITGLSPITQTIIHKVISPEFFPNIIKLAVENDILTQTVAEERFNLSSYILQNILGTFILGLFCAAILALLFGRLY